MNRLELESLDIEDLRALGKKAKLKTKLKAKIIAALADDYREGKATNIAAPSLNGTAPGTTPPATDTDSIVWPDVPPAVSAVNGEYVEPPWLAELVAAASIGHVELMGPAGSGKTLAVHHLAAQQGRNLAVVTADGGLRKRDLIGQVGMANGSTTFVAGEFAAAARNGDWALIDEANMAEPDAISFINGMTDRPNQVGSTFQVAGQTVEVHPDFRCFMTRNPNYTGTRKMNEALRDRFWPIMVPPLSGESLAAMFAAHDVNVHDIPESTWLIDQLYKAWQNSTISYQVSPRRALSAAHMFRATSQEDIRYWLGRSILNMIDAPHDQESVSQKIAAAWRAYDLLPGDHRSKTYGQ